MPHQGYIPTIEHRRKLSYKAKLRGNNGWLNRKHRLDSIEKMCRPKSIETRVKMRESAYTRWAREYDKKEELDPQPNIPQGSGVVKYNLTHNLTPKYTPYRDIFMENNNIIIDRDGGVWFEVD